MRAPQKSVGPAATDPNATKNTVTPSIAPAQKIGNARLVLTLDSARREKEITILIARLALAGHVVHRGAAGDFTCCRWGLTKYCADADALRAFARRLGVL